MEEKIELLEDELVREERFQQNLLTAKRAMRTASITTPILVGCIYLAMRRLPEDVFPADFWMIALVMPILLMLFQFGLLLTLERFSHRKCTLSARGIWFGMPRPKLILWHSLAEWQVEGSQTLPPRFTVTFRQRLGRRNRRGHAIRIIVPTTYPQETVRAFIKHHAPASAQTCSSA